MQLKSNLLGTEYTAWLKGGGPSAHKGYGAQALAVRYQPTGATPTGGARGMAAILPAPGEGLWVPQGGAGDAPDALGPLADRALRHELSPAMERRVMLLHNTTPFYDEAKGGGFWVLASFGLFEGWGYGCALV